MAVQLPSPRSRECAAQFVTEAEPTLFTQLGGILRCFPANFIYLLPQFPNMSLQLPALGEAPSGFSQVRQSCVDAWSLVRRGNLLRVLVHQLQLLLFPVLVRPALHLLLLTVFLLFS